MCSGLPYNGMCFQFLSDFSDYDSAALLCSSTLPNNATLAVCADYDIHDEIQNYLRSLSGNSVTVWLGGIYNHTTEMTHWVDGTVSAIDSSFWYPNYPYSTDTEAFYALWTRVGGYIADDPAAQQGFFNVPPERTYSPVCQFPMV